MPESSPDIRACTGKKRFTSKQAALKVLRGRQARGTFSVLHAYRCSLCFGWHLGHRS